MQKKLAIFSDHPVLIIITSFTLFYLTMNAGPQLLTGVYKPHLYFLFYALGKIKFSYSNFYSTFNIAIDWLHLTYNLVPRIFFIFCVLIYLSLFAKVPLKTVGINLSCGKGLKYTFKFFAATCAIVFLVYVIVLNLLNLYDPTFFASLNSVQTNGDFDVGILLAPFPEELLFRGILCTYLARYLRWRYVIFLNGIIFAAFHYISSPLEISHAASICAHGWFYAWIFYHTRSLVLPIFWHLFWNSTEILIPFYYPIWQKIYEMFVL